MAKYSLQAQRVNRIQTVSVPTQSALARNVRFPPIADIAIPLQLAGMNALEIIAASVGLLVIAVVLWNLRQGSAPQTGDTLERENAWMSNDWPAGPND